jgi:hypothetical protein
MNRIQRLLSRATGKPEYNMRLLLNSLSPSGIVPDVDKYYVFVYKAKTPNIRYDKHPFIICTGVYRWGFSGYNVHWNDWRRYSWNEVVTNIYEINESEIRDMERFPIAKFVSS